MPYIPKCQMPIDPLNPPPGYEVFTIKAGALYIDRASFLILDGIYILQVGSAVLEESDRRQDDSLAFGLRVWLRRLTMIKWDSEQDMEFHGDGGFGFKVEDD